MPLHLLGKKSWNVYNGENIDRVRRDEAQAKAREEADEQRMQEEDAQRRIALLRGEHVAPLPPPPAEEKPGEGQRWREERTDDTYSQRDLKRKRRRGEDDTDRDMRYAKQHNTPLGERKTRELLSSKEKEAPLEDHSGHIQLFPAPDESTIRKVEKNADAEAEKAKRQKREEDQYTMRFSNAAGFQNGMQKPWYAASNEVSKTAAAGAAAPSTDLVLADAPSKDVWGNEDPRRKERERNRVSSNDPFAAMQQAQRQLKQSVRDKESWKRKQWAEMEEMGREEGRARHSPRRRRTDREDSLDGFSLDAPAKGGQGGGQHDRRRRHRHHHKHRHRSKSHSRENDEGDRHRHRHKER